MKDNIILTDCDGVLLDWEPYFYNWVKEKQGLEVKFPDEYNVAKALGIPKSEGFRLVSEFNSSMHMANIGPLRDAVKYVRKLYTDYGYRFHVITSQTDDNAAKEFRKYNLETLFGKEVFEGFTILSQGADKDKALLKWKDTECYWIEDKPTNYTIGKNLGLNSILVSHRHNKDFEGNVVNNWKELYNKITGE
jgi:FMN phosphatase YigB (HAD superfamily)